MSPVLSKRTLQSIRHVLNEADPSMVWPTTREREALVAQIDSALKTKKFVKASRTRRVARKKTRKALVSELRAAAMERAGGRCEWPCCEAGVLSLNGLELDHVFGGNGRRRSLESLQTVWFLCHEHHRLKTLNVGGAAVWIDAFRSHALGHADTCDSNGDLNAGYDYREAAAIAKSRRDALALQGRAP